MPLAETNSSELTLRLVNIPVRTVGDAVDGAFAGELGV